MRKAVTCLALSAVLLGAWIGATCTQACATQAKACASCCGGVSGQDGVTGTDDCQKPLCRQPQSGIQSSLQSELSERPAPPLVAILSTRGGWERHPQGIDALQPGLRDLGPPVPPPLFTVLRT